MSLKPSVWTVPHGDGWANRREGSDRVSKTFETKEEARLAGSDMVRREHAEHFVQKKDVTIEERNSYGSDPYPLEG